jgi:hypothetical protein
MALNLSAFAEFLWLLKHESMHVSWRDSSPRDGLNAAHVDGLEMV